MTGTVGVIGTLDTKGPEVAYLRDRLQALGLATTVIDAGILGEPLGIAADISACEVARAGGDTLEEIRAVGSRGPAVERMRDALQAVVRDLYSRGRLDAVVGMGGAEGAVMSAAAMMVLPLGVAKVLISPIASGKHFFGPLVGTRDIMVIHSVVDILGLNPIATTIFDNAAAAIAGMVAHGHPLQPSEPGRRYVAVTMLGNTTAAVMAVRDRLAESGYEAVVFHSNGVGGPAMEELAADGHFVGVIDYTTNEVTDPLVGGIHDGGPDRLRRVGELGLPQVVVPGCIDFSVFHTGTAPASLADRPTYDHNPEYTLVRTPLAEMRQIGEIFAERLNLATGPVHVVVPTEGLSIPSTPEGPFWNTAADAAFLDSLRTRLRTDIEVSTVPRHVNDPQFGRHVAEVFLQTIQSRTAATVS